MQWVVGGGGNFPGKKRYEGVRFNVISVTRGWVGVKFTGKKRYVTQCTGQRYYHYEGVGGGGGQIPRKKTLRNTLMAPK